MKTQRLTCLLAFLLCFQPIASSVAQERNDCQVLATKIEKLEKLDVSGMSPTLRELHKQALLKVYRQFGKCVETDIAAVKEMQRIVAGTEAAPEVENKLRALLKAKSQNEDKLLIVGESLNLPEDAGQATTPRTDQNENVTRQTANAGNGISRSVPALVPVPTVIQGNCATSVAYDSAPGILKDLVSGLASDVVAQNNPDIAAQAGPQIVLYTVFDAASSRSSEQVHGLEAYQYLGETARTDKQLGASANSDGAVSGIEKPGFAQLLGFALEHGGINKVNDGTNLTLSTSLYSLYTLANKDTATNYARSGILNRLALAATFAVDDKDNELANARRNNLSEWSAKLRLFGDRSTRSPGFQKVFSEKVRPLIRARLRTLGHAMDELATKNAAYGTLEDAALDTLPNEVQARMACPDYTGGTVAQKQEIVAAVILGRLRTAVYQPVSTKAFNLGDDEIARIEGEFLPNLKEALNNLVLADGIIKEAMEDLQKGPLATFAYTNHRIPAGSDYSETKFLFEQEKGFMGPLKLNGNIGMSLYNRPDRTLNQQRVRDFSAALSFEGKSDSPFTEADNRSKITYSFVGRYERLFENRRRPNRTPDIGTLQFVTEIPLFKGLSLPFSITYSTATEEEKKQGFRFNFGTRFDMDKLMELLRANSQR